LVTSARDRDALALSARELVREKPRHFRAQPDEVEDLRDPVVLLLAR
jgi:hypothetical protein